MATPEEHIAQQLRDELQARIGAWKAEREQLLRASVRIAELDALIALAEDDTKTEFKVAPRPCPTPLPAPPDGPVPELPAQAAAAATLNRKKNA